MMRGHDIQLLYAYNRWANAQTLNAASRLTTKQFVQNIQSSFTSVRDTLVHILSAEWIWLMRWKGDSRREMFRPEDFPNLEILRGKWMEVEEEQADFVSPLTDESLLRVIEYTNTIGEKWKYPLGQMLVHLANHSTYHRGQVTTMLRQLGAKPEATDFLIFMDIGGEQWTQ